MHPIRIVLLACAFVFACGSKASSDASVLEVTSPSSRRILHVEDLRKLDRHEVTLKGARFVGARVQDVVGELAANELVAVHGADGYTQTLAAATLRREDCLVAYEKAGEAISAPEGPLRLVVPGSPGLSVHGLTRIDVRTAP